MLWINVLVRELLFHCERFDPFERFMLLFTCDGFAFFFSLFSSLHDMRCICRTLTVSEQQQELMFSHNEFEMWTPNQKKKTNSKNKKASIMQVAETEVQQHPKSPKWNVPKKMAKKIHCTRVGKTKEQWVGRLLLMESTIQVKHACMVCFFSQFFFFLEKKLSIPMAFSVWLHFQCAWQLIVSHSMLNEIYHGYDLRTHRMARREIVLKTRLRACIEL